MNFTVIRTESSVYIEIHNDNRSEIYFVKMCQNRFQTKTVKNIFFLAVRSQLKTVNVMNLPPLQMDNLKESKIKLSNDLKVYYKHRSRKHHNEQVEISFFRTGRLIGQI